LILVRSVDRDEDGFKIKKGVLDGGVPDLWCGRLAAEGALMPARKSHGHGPVLAVLRSPAHRLLSGMAIELRYTGRRSGREFTLPVQYAPDERR